MVERESPVKYLAITREEAIVAARAAAFTTGEGRVIVHCFMGGFGADWDLAGVEDVIERSMAVGWVDHILDHDLMVQTDGKLRFFDVKHPVDLTSGRE
jgi:hypothetical protein